MTTIYGSLSALKSTLSISVTTWDTDLTNSLTAASRLIDKECGRFFYQDSAATVVRYFTPSTPWCVRINDLVSAATVAIDTGGTGTFGTTWASGTNFNLAPYNAAVDLWPYESLETRSGSILPSYPRSVKITGQWGWPAVPDEVTEAATILASRLFKRKREAPLGVFGLGVDGTAVRISRTDPDVAALISDFSRRVMAV